MRDVRFHELIITDLEARHGARRKGFKKALRAALLCDGADIAPERDVESTAWRVYVERQRAIALEAGEEPGEPHDDLACFTKVPDAFLILPAQRIARCYEVEVSNPLHEDDLDHYGGLWWVLDEFHWELELVCVDRFGAERRVDLLEWECLSGAERVRQESGRSPAVSARAYAAELRKRLGSVRP